MQTISKMTMKRIAKAKNKFNIFIEEAPIPKISHTEVLIKAKYTLISRGSEIWRRYVRPEAIQQKMMGYCLTGEIVKTGDLVQSFSVGDKVAAVAPHSEFVSVDTNSKNLTPSIVKLPDEIELKEGTFWPLSTSAVLWINEISKLITINDQIITIMGQGLVGSLIMQVALSQRPKKIIAVDTISYRCKLAKELGSHFVINSSENSLIDNINKITNEKKSNVVIEAVGGPGGKNAFKDSLKIVSQDGIIQVIGLYENEPLQFNSGEIQGKKIIGGFSTNTDRKWASNQALKLISEKSIQPKKMISHNFHYTEASTAFEMLYENISNLMGVVFNWD